MTVKDLLIKFDDHNRYLCLNDNNLDKICKICQIFRCGVDGEDDLSDFCEPFLDMEVVAWGSYDDEITIRLPILKSKVDYSKLPKEYKLEGNPGSSD